MKFLFLSLVTFRTAFAMPALAAKADIFADWAPPGPGDVRAPCPMLNTLANHGFINRNGKNLTEPQITSALSDIINMDVTVGAELFSFALKTVPPNSTSFDLDNLRAHNILEHDGSLSREDAFFGDNHDFDKATFDQTQAYWTTDPITLQQAANARVARLLTSKATNPTFEIDAFGTDFSFGGSAAYLLVFPVGPRSQLSANRSQVQFWFENERFPTQLGWVKPAEPLDLNGLFTAIIQVSNATTATFPFPVPGGAQAPSGNATAANLTAVPLPVRKRSMMRRAEVRRADVKRGFHWM